MKFVLKVIDYAAIIISMLLLMGIGLLAVVGAIQAVWGQLRYDWSNDKLIVVIGSVCISWCVIRWKALNRPGG